MTTQDTPNEILNVEEAAKLLRVSSRTVRDFAHRGIIPARKVGRDWRFTRAALIRWLEEDKQETN